ncbi:uncharacterized protein LOC111712461 [Eurytemora carolleeae]|uniref:uncharacterized protein LOC111712461 n=1 Tax=Eurytemora carolleeae TaxID=1294199 RepID=UPI000C7590B3|nr:uncharacterized protein LOC111712461 [Eurytemora carolleeae]|eukprot:XP_023342841.1 uncharacterized protein LOC111712461 [Eurytemora affinis]
MRWETLTIFLASFSFSLCIDVAKPVAPGSFNIAGGVGLPIAGAILNQNRAPAKNFYNITSGDDVLAFLASSGPMLLELVKVTSTGLKSYSPKLYYNMSGETTVTGSRNDDTVTIKIEYKGGSKSTEFTVSEAEINMDIQVGGSKAPRSDYWLVTKAGISVSFSFNSTDDKQTVDITPKFGYTNRKADLACDAKHSVCAPLALTWTCTDQTFKKEILTDLKVGANTVILHIPGMKLQPFKTGAAKPAFGYRWDCDPLLVLVLVLDYIISRFGYRWDCIW